MDLSALLRLCKTAGQHLWQLGPDARKQELPQGAAFAQDFADP